jgi:DNA-binding response OmpR family regulator
LHRNSGSLLIYLTGMATNHTLLCIHRDPAQLSLLKENGYELVTAGSGSDALQLLMSQSVDAVVLDYELSHLPGAAVAAEMKKVKPQVPIVMLTDHLELTDGTLKSVDALVTKSDGPHFLWATVHFILSVKPAQHLEGKLSDQTPARLRRPGKSREGWNGSRPTLLKLASDEKALPFSLRVWQRIRNGAGQS